MTSLTECVHNFPQGLLLFVDLDDTLINQGINNTFDFLRSYLHYNYGLVGITRYRLASLVSGFLNKLAGNEIISRKFFIVICTFGLMKSRLCEYAVKYWLKFVRIHANHILLKLISKLKERGYSSILLTSCPEIPACAVAKSLGFEQCIATKFRCLGNLIIGISEDTCGRLKLQVVRDKYGNKVLRHSVYIVDIRSAEIERPYRFFGKIYLVDQGRIKNPNSQDRNS